MFNEENFDHISSQKNWTFTENDFKAEAILSKIQHQARQDMPHKGPHSIYSPFVMTHYEEMKKHKLYSLMKTIPKGVLHHCHIDCCEDKQYYRKFIITDPIIYLSQDMTQFRIGTKKQAQEENWVSMNNLRNKFSSEDEVVDFISRLSIITLEQHKGLATRQIQFWSLFDKKLFAFFTILNSLHHFREYMKHICQKFILNGYDRLQFRALITSLTQYDKEGNVISQHSQRKYMQVLDEVESYCKETNPNFTLGIIWFGLEKFSLEKNEELFTKICELNWTKTIGFDLLGFDIVDEENVCLISDHDRMVTKVLEKFPHLNYKKVYHAGQTKDHLNSNLQTAVDAGCVRVGHGINILQRPELLSKCKNICFQINHISNIVIGLRDDTRLSNAPLLLFLGYALTINPDDPGKFGYEDSTVDYFSAFISFKWSLKELKLLGIHSINHAICSQQEKTQLLNSYNEKWNLWVHNLVQSQGL